MENLEDIHNILDDLTCNIDEYINENTPIVKTYQPRAKDENNTNFWTLYQRKYPNIRANYYRRNAEKIKEKSKERYKNDPIYREKMILRARLQHQKKIQTKLEADMELNDK